MGSPGAIFAATKRHALYSRPLGQCFEFAKRWRSTRHCAYCRSVGFDYIIANATAGYKHAHTAPVVR